MPNPLLASMYSGAGNPHPWTADYGEPPDPAIYAPDPPWTSTDGPPIRKVNYLGKDGRAKTEEEEYHRQVEWLKKALDEDAKGKYAGPGGQHTKQDIRTLNGATPGAVSAYGVGVPSNYDLKLWNARYGVQQQGLANEKMKAEADKTRAEASLRQYSPEAIKFQATGALAAQGNPHATSLMENLAGFTTPQAVIERVMPPGTVKAGAPAPELLDLLRHAEATKAELAPTEQTALRQQYGPEIESRVAGKPYTTRESLLDAMFAAPGAAVEWVTGAAPGSTDFLTKLFGSMTPRSKAERLTKKHFGAKAGVQVGASDQVTPGVR